MPTFSADKLIGKTLTAKRTLNAWDLPTYYPNAVKIGTIKFGNTAGVVDSFVGGTPGRPLFWQFKGVNGKKYYILHEEGAFDIQALKDQGVTTTKEDAEKEEEKNKTFSEKLADYLKKSGNVIIYTGLGLLALNIILKNRK